MLPLKWLVNPTEPPGDDPDFARKTDRLEGAHTQLLMDVPKGDPRTRELPTPSQDLIKHVGDWLGRRSDQHRPPVVMIHGFMFEPQKVGAKDDPFMRVYALPGSETVVGESWLGFVDDQDAVAFAWSSDPGVFEKATACWTNVYEYAVNDIAPLAARAVATVILAFRAKSRSVNLVAHSLGTRVAVKAMELLAHNGAAGAVERAVLLAGAEYSIDALRAMQATDKQKTVRAHVYNFAGCDDTVLSCLGTHFGSRQRLPSDDSSRVIGNSGLKRLENWIDLQVDGEQGKIVSDWFANKLGEPAFHLSNAPVHGRGAHWAIFMHEGNRRLFREILVGTAWSLSDLRGPTPPVPEGVNIGGATKFEYGKFNDERVPRLLLKCAERQHQHS